MYFNQKDTFSICTFPKHFCDFLGRALRSLSHQKNADNFSLKTKELISPEDLDFLKC